MQQDNWQADTKHARIAAGSTLRVGMALGMLVLVVLGMSLGLVEVAKATHQAADDASLHVAVEATNTLELGTTFADASDQSPWDAELSGQAITLPHDELAASGFDETDAIEEIAELDDSDPNLLTIPEPGTLAALALAVLMMWGFRRR